MVFMTSMTAMFLATHLGKAGVVYGFIVALCMEVINLMMMTKTAKKAEDIMKRKFNKLVDGYKAREQAFEEADASVKRSNEALERQLSEYIDKINDLEMKVRDKEKQVDEYKDLITRQEKVIAAATKPVWE